MKPILQSLLLADHVYEDKQTGKRIIAGVFNRLFFNKKPPVLNVDDGGKTKTIIQGGMQAGSPYAYLSLTEVPQSQKFVLRFVNLSEDQSLLETIFELQCTDPVATVEIVLPLPKLPITGAGAYALELTLDDGEPIGSLRISVEELPDIGSEEQ